MCVIAAQFLNATYIDKHSFSVGNGVLSHRPRFWESRVRGYPNRRRKPGRAWNEVSPAAELFALMSNVDEGAMSER